MLLKIIDSSENSVKLSSSRTFVLFCYTTIWQFLFAVHTGRFLSAPREENRFFFSSCDAKIINWRRNFVRAKRV